ncbi:MAG: anaerobic sulfatase maturase, partial [Methanomicrobiales archaeon HGW-Methanomicrobiales-2]
MMDWSDGEAPLAFHVMAKPTGARCNLDCAYCFFLKKEHLYPDSNFRMTDEVMEQFIRQTIEGHRVPHVTIAWQGGEPTLMGLEFFRRSLEVQKRYARPGTRIENTFQTNGILLDDEWCRFFHDNNFLIGLSMDGPGHLHDVYRRDRRGRGTVSPGPNAAPPPPKHPGEFNILCAG